MQTESALPAERPEQRFRVLGLGFRVTNHVVQTERALALCALDDGSGILELRGSEPERLPGIWSVLDTHDAVVLLVVDVVVKEYRMDTKIVERQPHGLACVWEEVCGLSLASSQNLGFRVEEVYGSGNSHHGPLECAAPGRRKQGEGGWGHTFQYE